MVSVVIPTVNERENLEPLFRRLRETLQRLGHSYEVLLVDSDSDDGTAEVAQAWLGGWLAGAVIRCTRETDLAHAVYEGVQHAQGDYIVVMDADLSHPPELIPALITSLESGHEVAVASRYIPGAGAAQWSWPRRACSRVASLFVRPLVHLRDGASGYFACQARLLNAMGQPSHGFKILLDLLVKTRPRRIQEIPYHFVDRQRGSSKLRLRTVWAGARQTAELYWLRWRRPSLTPMVDS